ncbi:MAG: hypothetical protein ABI680_17960 [Chthoniobacteraceae bacterium]
MKESHAKPPSRRLVIIGGLIAAGIICVFVLVPCTLREVGSRAALGRDISIWRQVDSAVRVYQLERDHFPASLDEPDLQPYLGEHVVTYLREGRVAYHPPAPDNPPTFIIVHMTKPRGDYSTQLDGIPLYPHS